VFDDIKYRHDIGVIHAACREGLAVKKLLRFGGGHQGLPNGFEGESLSGAFIGTSPHGCHSPLPKQMFDAVLAIYQLPRPQDRLGRTQRLGSNLPHASAPLQPVMRRPPLMPF
jgi:hypothetical protein